ncbi:MAG TPA: endonuclease V [Sedimentisphaerales bacterium]|nr:endonuclease V [Sedimentisphaerales bacterium]HRS10385.1 endonuclease V [Sedimentisphaerales bacterium]HRV47090.1 endonuclease V [Sedimentisphaerales bacterium]
MPKLHKWDLSYAEARELQTRLAGKVRFDPLKTEPEIVAGLDCAFMDGGKRIVAAVVVLRRVAASTAKESEVVQKRPHPQAAPEAATQTLFEVVETASATMDVTFPYIPGLLSFREAPACLGAVAKLESRPDLFLIDGQGVAHPRRLGLAAHLGLFLDRPTIGCAKSRLIGTFEEPGTAKGAHSPLYDGDEMIGAVVRTRTRVKPLFVSVGHRCRLEDAIRLTLACTTKYRLPEPTRLAHQVVSQLKC